MASSAATSPTKAGSTNDSRTFAVARAADAASALPCLMRCSVRSSSTQRSRYLRAKKASPSSGVPMVYCPTNFSVPSGRRRYTEPSAAARPNGVICSMSMPENSLVNPWLASYLLLTVAVTMTTGWFG